MLLDSTTLCNCKHRRTKCTCDTWEVLVDEIGMAGLGWLVFDKGVHLCKAVDFGEMNKEIEIYISSHSCPVFHGRVCNYLRSWIYYKFYLTLHAT